MTWADDYVDGILDRCFDYTPNPRKKQKAKAKQMAKRYERGDLVRKKFGTRAIEVVDPNYGDYFYGRYVHSGTSAGRLHVRDVVAYEDENVAATKGHEKMKGKLFQTKEAEPRFGIGLAINSQGKYVLEMKGTGDLLPFDKSEIEVVMPFTFNVQFNGAGTEYSYLGKEGTVGVGDLLLKTDGSKGIVIAKVTAVNTKSEKATKYFDGVKIVTVALDN